MVERKLISRKRGLKKNCHCVCPKVLDKKIFCTVQKSRGLFRPPENVGHESNYSAHSLEMLMIGFSSRMFTSLMHLDSLAGTIINHQIVDLLP